MFSKYTFGQRAYPRAKKRLLEMLSRALEKREKKRRKQLQARKEKNHPIGGAGQ